MSRLVVCLLTLLFSLSGPAMGEYSAFERSSLAAKATAGVADDAFSHGLKYADRVRVRGVQDPVSHNFPYSFDDAILATKPIPKNNGYNMFQKPGSMNGKDGVFEMGVTKDGVIDHRFFRPDK